MSQSVLAAVTEYQRHFFLIVLEAGKSKTKASGEGSIPGSQTAPRLVLGGGREGGRERERERGG